MSLTSGAAAGDAVSVRRAGEADIPFVMATERRPGYERTLGRWEEAMHREALGDPSRTAYFIAERNGRPLAFAILRDLDDPSGNVLLKRIAVAEQDRGIGRALLVPVMDWCFAAPRAHRLWLTVALHNERARHLYRSLGFREDGVMREAHVNPAGERVTSALMSILRPEWEAVRPSASPES